MRPWAVAPTSVSVTSITAVAGSGTVSAPGNSIISADDVDEPLRVGLTSSSLLVTLILIDFLKNILLTCSGVRKTCAVILKILKVSCYSDFHVVSTYVGVVGHLSRV